MIIFVVNSEDMKKQFCSGTWTPSNLFTYIMKTVFRKEYSDEINKDYPDKGRLLDLFNDYHKIITHKNKNDTILQINRIKPSKVVLIGKYIEHLKIPLRTLGFKVYTLPYPAKGHQSKFCRLLSDII